MTSANANTAAALQRPELLLGPNPFISEVPPPIAFSKLPHELKHAPLSKLPWRDLPPDLREPLLEISSQHFASTSALLEAASGIQILFRRALLMRNPLQVEERKRMNQLGLISGTPSLRALTRLEGAGMLLTGMTGTGKTALLRRMLELIAPEQVINYGDSEACGWYQLRQCVYLRVDHPSNGTRGALLKRILEELDSVLGTSYFQDHKRTTNLDTLLVVVCKLLSLHRVALVSIDEKQQSSFSDSPWRLDFVLFYLTLMNLGISVVLSGNPLAFDHLRSYSQVMRRFSTGGIHNLLPASSSKEKWWQRDFVPQTREFSLVDQWDITPERRELLEFEHSGGLPGLFAPFNVEVQRSALRRGGERAIVTEKDFTAAARSPRYVEARAIALALADAGSSSNQFLDIPPNEAGDPVPKAGGTPTPRSVPTEHTVSVVKALLASYRRSETNRANTLVRRLESLKNLDPEDIRSLGLTQDLLAGFERAVSTASSKAKPRKRGVNGNAANEQPQN
jgi:hypothetical protein